jgi:3-phytase
VRTTAFDPRSKLARDVEGLTIYYAGDGAGYLLASSQGQAHGEPPTLPSPGLDDTFAVFSRASGNRYLGSFSISAHGARGIDAVLECDGADVINVPLPGFGGGLLITQDGYNDDLHGLDGEVNATNLKFTSWRLVAEHFPGGPLKVDPEGYDPRRPSAR